MYLLLQVIRGILTNPASLLDLIRDGLWPPIRLRLKTTIFGPYHPVYYPREVRRLVKDFCPSELNVTCRRRQCWPFLKPLKVSSEVNTAVSKLRLRFVGRELTLEELLEYWRGGSPASEDAEFRSSLHRFHWLFYFLSEARTQEDLDLNNSALVEWASLHIERKIGAVEAVPYCISERICNIVVYLQLLALSNLEVKGLDVIEKSLLKDVDFLLLHLEYPASRAVNNHILNNARALYFAGVHFSSNEITEIAKSIFQKHLDVMIGAGGFLLEASSHYQFLLTRSMVEVAQLSAFDSDANFTREMNDLSRKMIGASQFLLRGDEHYSSLFPLIGDVSPDCPPNWFLPVPNHSEHGWHQFWNYHFSNHQQFQSNEVDGWLRLNRGDYTLTTYLHPDADTFPLGHGHTDFGSFTLQCDNEFIFIDVGRFSYSQPEAIGPDCIVNKHNSIYVCDNPALQTNAGIHGWMQRINSQQHEHNWSSDGPEVRFRVSTRKLRWDRKIDMAEEGIIKISDSVDCQNTINGYLNLSPDAQIVKHSDFSFSIRTEETELGLQIFGVVSAGLERCLVYPEYGSKSTTTRIHWESDISDGCHNIKLVLTLRRPLD